MADAEGTLTSLPADGAQSPATGLPDPQDAPQATPGDWRATLPEGLRGEKSLATFKDVGALAQSFLETKKMQGAMVAIPGKDAKPEQVAAFREKLGVPKDPSGYTPPAAPEGQALDQARWERWAGYAHKLGLTPDQLTSLATLEAEERAGLLTGVKQEWAAGLKTLEEQWGPALFSKNVTLASRAVDRHMSPEGKAFLDESGLGNHPELVKAWASVGQLLAEDGYIEGRIVGLPGVDEAKAKIAEIRAQGKAHPANNGDHPQHAQASEALAALYKLAYGT